MNEEKALALRETLLLPADIEEMEFRELLVEKATDIKQLLSPKRNIDRFIKQTMIAVSRNSKLAQCTKKSLFISTVDCAELDLDFTPSKGWAYLVPYKNEASFMPGYRGFIELATRGGRVTNIESILVHQKDEFEIIKGSHPEIIHKLSLEPDRGKVIGCYSLAWFPGGGHQSEWMTTDEIKEIQKRAKTQYIWNSDPGEMYRKTPVRRLFKYLPTSPEIAKATEHDNNQYLVQGTETPSLDETMAVKMAEMEAETPDPITDTIKTEIVAPETPETPSGANEFDCSPEALEKEQNAKESQTKMKLGAGQ